MKLKLIAAVFILSNGTESCFAVRVRMAHQGELEQRLDELGFSYLAEKTGIVHILGGKTKESIGVVNAVDVALEKYREKTIPVFVKMAYKMRDYIIAALLQEYPLAIKELQEHGFISIRQTLKTFADKATQTEPDASAS